MEEFSEFQMAVGQSSVDLQSVNARGKSLWVKDHSPTNKPSLQHNNAGFNNSGNSFHPLNTSLLTVSSPTTRNRVEKSVGSRLANYNLGMKSSRLIINEVLQPRSYQANAINVGMNPNNPNLLIGEEDKYAALRAFISLDTNDSTEKYEGSSTILNKGSGSFEAMSCSTNPSKVGEYAEDEVNSDFGDFQCFTGSPKKNNIQMQPETFQSSHLIDSFVNNQFSTMKQDSALSNFGSEASQYEFGEYISVTPSIVPHIVPDVKRENLRIENRPSTNMSSDLTGMSAGSPGIVSSSSENWDPFDCFVNPTDSSPHLSTLSKRGVVNLPTASSKITNPITEDATTFPRRFIKTSLIGYDINFSDSDNFNDSPKCASPNETNNEALEYNSFHNSIEKNRSSDISPETLSIASLDLGNYCPSLDYNDNSKLPVDHWSGHNLNGGSTYTKTLTPLPITTTTTGGTLLPDTWNCLDNPDVTGLSNTFTSKEEPVVQTDMQSQIWSRCLTVGQEILSTGTALFNDAPNTEVIGEVVLHQKGNTYILGLLEVYLMCCRIHNSYCRMGGSPCIDTTYNKIQNLWETFTAFFIGTSASDWLACEGKSKHRPQGDKLCNICMVTVEENILDFEGATYHFPCANMWINYVDTSLPSISRIPIERKAHYNTSGDMREPLT